MVQNLFKNVSIKNYSNYLTVVFRKKVVNDGTFFYLDEVQKEPIIKYDLMGNANKNKYHSFIIVDPDAPVGFHIHECIYNIYEGEVEKGTFFYYYAPPNPPKGSGPNRDGKHRYYCVLYEQEGKIEKDLGIGERRGFANYGEFMKLLGVKCNAKGSKYFVCQFDKYSGIS